MMRQLYFTDEEIRAQLEAIGFENITDQQLRLFREDLERLLREDVGVNPIRPESPDDKVSRTSCNSDFSSESSCRSHVLIEKGESLKNNHLPTRVYMEPKSNAVKDTASDISYRISSSQPLMEPRKRKVLRYRNGRKVVCDETLNTNDLRVKSSTDDGGFLVNSEKPCSYARSWKSMSDLREVPKTLYKSKSVIIPCTRKSKCFKMDPVARYQYYKQQWATHKIPGEKDHRELRRNIRTMMSVYR